MQPEDENERAGLWRHDESESTAWGTPADVDESEGASDPETAADLEAPDLVYHEVPWSERVAVTAGKKLYRPEDYTELMADAVRASIMARPKLPPPTFEVWAIEYRFTVEGSQKHARSLEFRIESSWPVPGDPLPPTTLSVWRTHGQLEWLHGALERSLDAHLSLLPYDAPADRLADLCLPTFPSLSWRLIAAVAFRSLLGQPMFSDSDAKSLLGRLQIYLRALTAHAWLASERVLRDFLSEQNFNHVQNYHTI